MFRSQGAMNTPVGGNNNFVDKMSEYKWSIIIGVVALIGLALILYYYVFKPMSTPVNYNANNEGASQSSQNSNDKDAEIMFFYVDWCPHCKTAKPEWDQVKAQYDNKSINGYKVMFNEINCTDETPEKVKMIDTYKIEGYPTIKLVKDNQVIDFDAKPTKDTLTKFLNTVL